MTLVVLAQAEAARGDPLAAAKALTEARQGWPKGALTIGGAGA